MFLLDTDFIIALRFPGESTHMRAKALYEKQVVGQKLFVLESVLYEVGTVISKKYSQSEAVATVKFLRSGSVVIVTPSEKEKEKIWKTFYMQKRKNVSVVDCANLVMAKQLKLKLLSFDRFYLKSLRTA